MFALGHGGKYGVLVQMVWGADMDNVDIGVFGDFAVVRDRVLGAPNVRARPFRGGSI